MKKYVLTIACVMALVPRLCAQVYMSDYFNASTQAYDFSNQEVVTTAPSGVGYVANNSGEHYHHGPASATLTVNGFYNAYDPNLAGFTGTPSTPGLDYFQGLNGLKATAQEIAGNTTPRFGILKLDNGSTNQINITNTNGAEVGLRTDFANGITTTVRSNTNTGALKFLDNATYTGTLSKSLTSAVSDAQFVDGYVTKVGNDAFVYPVGGGGQYRPLQISAPATVTDAYSVAWMPGDPGTNGDPSNGNSFHPITSVTAPVTLVSPVGQWDWIAQSGTGAGLTVTVNIPDMTTFAAATNLRLVGWNGTSWVDLSGGPTASGAAENNTLSGTMIAGISAIGIGSISGPLPVKLVDFNTHRNGQDGLLNWVTASEENTTHFTIEESMDSRNFKPLGVIDAAGTTSIEHHYSFIHERPATGIHYYRLKIIDANGSFEYSPVRTLTFTEGGIPDIRLFPNPTTDRTTVTGVKQGSLIRVLSANGAIIMEQQALSDTEVLDLHAVPAGIYIVAVIDTNAMTTFKLIRQ